MRKMAFKPGISLIHQLYPLTKLSYLLICTGLFFLTANTILLGCSIFLLTVLNLKVHADLFKIRGIRLVFTTAVALLMMYILFDKTGDVVLATELSILRITTGGLHSGFVFSSRFLSIVLLSYLFVLTTEPGDLAYALMKSGLPYRWGFMFVTALRLAPIMEEEGRTIYQAQLARGIRYDQRGIKQLHYLIQQFMTPLLIVALRKADRLFFSMEGRGFGKHPQRTFYRDVKLTYLDALAITALIGLLITYYLLFIQI